MPSILKSLGVIGGITQEGFKPYYKWNAFNTTLNLLYVVFSCLVLNLVISGMPSILM